MDNYNKMFSQYEVYHIIDEKIKQESEYKNRYIQLNGYGHKDVLERFDNRIAALNELYKEFNDNGTF